MAKQLPSYVTALVALYQQPRSVSSVFARYSAQDLGMLASRGYVTTREPGTRDVYGKLWRPTALGLLHLQDLDLL